MVIRLGLLLLLIATAALGQLVGEVRAALRRDDFAAAERLVREARGAAGVTPEVLEALSWLGRGALGAGEIDKAERYAAETRELSLGLLKNRKLDDERRLPTALGASIEVQAQVLAGRGARSEAVTFLEKELAAWRNTSIRTRIQKNLNLLTLEGKPAPALEVSEFLGPKPLPIDALKGRVVLLFFWAHWCGECKAQAPVLARLQAEFGKQGLVIVGPTQRYGYAARGREVSPAEELAHIEQVRTISYSALADMPVPVSEENFKKYGSSTTPTLVLVDGRGLVRLYRPGNMSYEELAPAVKELTAARPRGSG